MPLAFFMEYIWNRFTGKVSPHFRSNARPTKSNLILADFTSIGIQVHRKKKKRKMKKKNGKLSWSNSYLRLQLLSMLLLLKSEVFSKRAKLIHFLRGKPPPETLFAKTAQCVSNNRDFDLVLFCSQVQELLLTLSSDDCLSHPFAWRNVQIDTWWPRFSGQVISTRNEFTTVK